MKKATAAQIRKLHVLGRERGMDDDLLHEYIGMLTGKESIRDMSCQDAVRVIDALEGKRAAGEKHASSRQMAYIMGLVRGLGWVDKHGNADTGRLDGMCKKLAGIHSHKWLDKKQASDLIEALKNMGQKRKPDQEREADHHEKE